MAKLIRNNFSVALAKRLLKISTVARETGLSRTTLTDLYYRRTKQVALDTLDRLCAYLNCPIGEIFEYETDSADPQRRDGLY